MAKRKLYIAVKCGLIEDAKHREAIGNRIWLYLHILNRANWDTGQILEWRDREEAEELDMPKRTLTAQRQELEQMGYISCKQGRGKQIITVHNWTNPRSYGNQVVNPKNKDTQNYVPLEDNGTANGTANGTINGSIELSTSSLNQRTENQSTEREGASAPPSPPQSNTAIEAILKITHKRAIPLDLQEEISDLVGSNPNIELLEACWREWAIVREYRRSNWNWLFDWYKNGGIPKNGNGHKSNEPIKVNREVPCREFVDKAPF